jgi:molybdopterin/thiamine biosynthesis adenylyltransferase
MPVLDMVARDPSVRRVTLIEPDVYKPHNIERHLFPSSGVGRLKAELARQWLVERRPELEVEVRAWDLLDPAVQDELDQLTAAADVGVCAVDNEPAKYHWDALMRRHGKPWTLGEVLSGGIGGFVHAFVPGGPCYGCVASHLKRSVTVEKPVVPDYSQPGGPAAETTVPASMASIHAIASLHAVLTLGIVADANGYDPGFTSLLLTLRRVPDVFKEAFQPHRLRIARKGDCLICQARPTPTDPAELDAALNQALARLADD